MNAAALYDQRQRMRRRRQRRQISAPPRPGSRACETAMMTHGGMGYAKEYHVERYFRESHDRPHRARSARN